MYAIDALGLDGEFAGCSSGHPADFTIEVTLVAIGACRSDFRRGTAAAKQAKRSSHSVLATVGAGRDAEITAEGASRVLRRNAGLLRPFSDRFAFTGDDILSQRTRELFHPTGKLDGLRKRLVPDHHLGGALGRLHGIPTCAADDGLESLNSTCQIPCRCKLIDTPWQVQNPCARYAESIAVNVKRWVDDELSRSEAKTTVRAGFFVVACQDKRKIAFIVPVRG